MLVRERISRRRFIRGASATVAALTAGGRAIAAPSGRIDHVVLVMMENRSFDHALGWLPGANGKQAGLTYYDSAGVPHHTYPLAPDYQGCAHPDPDHSYAGGRAEYDNGACDGWLRAGSNDEYAIGYYGRSDLPFLAGAAPNWTACDQYFAAIMAETYPNRIYQHAAQTDRIDNSTQLSTLPTIWDRLAAAGLTGRYYFSDVPFLALWGAKYIPISRPVSSFLADCAAGTLPNVAFLDPRFVDEDSGTSGDDHPHADVRNGEAFMNLVYEAVISSPNWPNTVLLFNYDEWGGFFDHVAPSAAPIPPADASAGNADGLRGFRTPCLMISPWARRNYVSSTVYDHTSILKLIEWRWGLAPLTVRDRTANNPAAELDFSRPANLSSRRFDVPPGPFGAPCPAGSVAVSQSWTDLLGLARGYGWPV